MNYKIVSSDLDGTLLNNQMEVSDENRFAVKQYTDGGGVFVPNSGRSLGEMPRAVKEMPGVRFLICSDGADIYDKATDTRISLTMTKEEKDRVLAILGDYENFVTVHYRGNSYLDAARYDEATMRYNNVNDYFRIHFEETNFPTENFADFCASLADAEMICAFFHSREELEACRARLEDAGLVVAASDSYNVEVFAPRAGKGNALLRLAEHLGVAREETIAVGDSINDLSMIGAAGLGLAMGNARDAVKAAASAVACRNDEHIMPYLLRTYIEM